MEKAKISSFTHLIEIEPKITALWNALFLRTIFIEESISKLSTIIKTGFSEEDIVNNSISSGYSECMELIKVLKEQNFLIRQSEEEKKIYEIRKEIDNLPIGIMYLILSNQCNLKCSYCYLSEALSKESNDSKKNMSKATIIKSIDLMATITAKNGINNPQIIFYGGEPLLNYENLKFALDYCKSKIPEAIFIINTNGTLITEEIAKLFSDFNVNVSVSIDGPKDIHDSARVFHSGIGSFDIIIDNFKKLQKNNVNIGLSSTITPSNIDSLEETVFWFANYLNIKSIDLNLLIGKFDNEDEMISYAQKAAKKIINCYEITSKNNIHMEKMARKLKPFMDGFLVVNNCGGCGQQVVVTPDEKITVCQGKLNNQGNDFFDLNVSADLINHPLWTKWRKRSPFNINTCLDCEALGICGGGCPYSAELNSGDIYEIDKTNCSFNKEALKFLLSELWNHQKTNT